MEGRSEGERPEDGLAERTGGGSSGEVGGHRRQLEAVQILCTGITQGGAGVYVIVRVGRWSSGGASTGWSEALWGAKMRIRDSKGFPLRRTRWIWIWGASGRTGR